MPREDAYNGADKLDEKDSFNYLAFQQLKKIWGSSEIGITTKIRLFNAIVKPLLHYYGAETWRTTVNTIKKETGLSTHALGRSSRSPDPMARQDFQRRIM
ncbi:hypothetical protein DPMN_167736 [Dreissena polymorpha]|uniref:DUF6451 domain-containing protein n=1 Tax=Dreissena polymorpha TaxID=45954 RepID=A0A9D4F1E5_DREPO|nr:hypothetical protein DPMN_167736 [Dreissena polymorpha]